MAPLCCKFLSIFHKFTVSVVSQVKLLCVDKEDKPVTSSAVIPTVKLDGLRKSAIRSWNKRTVYNVYKFFRYF
jgi:hypothetical protein